MSRQGARLADAHPKGTPRTGLCQISNRSAARRNGNWKMALRDRRPKSVPQGPQCQQSPVRDWGASLTRGNVADYTPGNSTGYPVPIPSFRARDALDLGEKPVHEAKVVWRWLAGLVRFGQSRIRNPPSDRQSRPGRMTPPRADQGTAAVGARNPRSDGQFGRARSNEHGTH